jgi:2-polyprenyl-6-methoxyphenol hydroxylase-like FAD-dependent oxidoreductase
MHPADDEVVAERVKATGLPVTNVAVLSFDGGEKSDSGPLPLRIGLWGVNTAMSVARKVTSIFRRKEGGRGGGGVAITYTHLWHDVRMCLADRVREICGDSALQPGMTLVALRETSDDTGCRFELDFTCNSDGEEMTVCTGAIIACDGVGSTVRKLSREPKARDVQLL